MIIIQDSRERSPWDFVSYGFNQRIQKLDEGDYTVEGLEDKFIVERKRNTGELAINLGKKKKQFFDELKRLQKYPHKFIIFEFQLHDIFSFPVNSGIPKSDWKSLRITSNYMASCIDRIVSDCDIPIFFCSDKVGAERKFIEILNDVLKKT